MRQQPVLIKMLDSFDCNTRIRSGHSETENRLPTIEQRWSDRNIDTIFIGRGPFGNGDVDGCADRGDQDVDLSSVLVRFFFAVRSNKNSDRVTEVADVMDRPGQTPSGKLNQARH